VCLSCVGRFISGSAGSSTCSQCSTDQEVAVPVAGALPHTSEYSMIDDAAVLKYDLQLTTCKHHRLWSLLRSWKRASMDIVQQWC
jgi:hypothetical protein